MKFLLLCFLLSSRLAFGEVLQWTHPSLTVTYDETASEYELKTRAGEVRRYGRHRYESLVGDLRALFQVRDPALEESLTQHALLSRLSAPTPEEILEQGFRAQSLALGIMAISTAPCGGEGLELAGPSQYQLEVKDPAPVAHEVLQAEMAERGFFPLGRLTGLRVDVSSTNDNLWHGGAEGAGLTTYNQGVDGDDRGKTFGLSSELGFEFEDGEVVLRQTSQGYSRLAPQRTKVVLGGKEYMSEVRKDPEGRHYQEFISVDGVELEIKKELGFRDVYVRVIGKRVSVDDQSGLSQKLQERWHAMQKERGTIQYHYLDHTKKETRYEAGVGLGRDFVLYEANKFVVRSDASVGAGVNSDSAFSNLNTQIDLRIQSKRRLDVDQRYPAFEARLYAGARAYQDRGVDRTMGAEITGRVRVTENGFLYLKMGASADDDYYSRTYGSEEYKRHGRFDIQHHLGAGFEVRF